ncbi:MAG: serine--tRNA ligase [Acidobacteriota bacterium]
MLDPGWVRDRPEDLRKALANRGGDTAELERFLEADARRRQLLQEIETRKSERNRASDEIGRKRRAGENPDDRIAEMKRLAAEIRDLEPIVAEADAAARSILLGIPNVPDPSVPVGADESANPVVRTVGTPPELGFAPRDHAEIGEALGILDFARAARMSGARFAVYLGAGARLERALIQFMLDVHTREHGYREILPPFLVNRDAMTGTGQLPKFEPDLFRISGTDFFLIPTAEVPVTNLHREEILEPGRLPMKFVSYTPCFRAEAGSHGRDTRGLIRQHQFNKVELVKYADPETSYDELESLTANAEEILKRLGLAYRVVELCTGDLGFSAAKTYDLEVWVPSQDTYREISSCSNFTDYQARRAGIRYRAGKGGKPRFVHTLNGSGLAVGRTVVAILENFQQADGTVVIPEVLQPYMDGMERIAAGM